MRLTTWWFVHLGACVDTAAVAVGVARLPGAILGAHLHGGGACHAGFVWRVQQVHVGRLGDGVSGEGKLALAGAVDGAVAAALLRHGILAYLASIFEVVVHEAVQLEAQHCCTPRH